MKIIAWYLPQFHRIPENDKWWGDGFTEWTYVKKSTPLFKGHNQPRVPLNDNYYNLVNIDTLKWQTEIAKEYGIYGFCFYHYWFKGKKLLEKPIELFIQNDELESPFCLSWANVPWTRTWYDEEKTVLMPQDYGDEKDWKEHFDYLLQMFNDERYIKIDNKPVFLIYNSSEIEQCNEMMRFWTKLAKKNGFPGIYFINTLTSFPLGKKDLDFDAQVQFEPGFTLRHEMNKIWRIKRKIVVASRRIFRKYGIYNSVENLFDYDKFYKLILRSKKNNTKIKTYLSVFPDWDNTPRRGFASSIYLNSTPEKFEKFLTEQIKNSKKYYNSDILFINAWNEWGESAYLEPDKRYEFKYLEAVKNALNNTKR
jgi:hypothetical protein